MKRKASGEPATSAMAALEPALAPARGRIYCDRMRQQQEVRVVGEDWTGITDPKLRRRLQNRLNQRAKRKRESGRVQKKAFPDEQWDDLTEPPMKDPIAKPKPPPGSQQSATIIDKYKDRSPPPPHLWLPHLSGVTPTIALGVMRSYEAWLRTRRELPSPSSDLLLSLVQYNVFRALILNTFTLGFTMEWLADDAISPFCGLYATRPDSLYPDSLRPTALQKKVEHHPWLDLFPDPQMRNNMINRLETYDEDELCESLVGWHHGPMSSCGMIVWKDPWDVTGWEIGEEFVKNWTWVVAGCSGLEQSTNFWRSKRGEPPLRFEEVA